MTAKNVPKRVLNGRTGARRVPTHDVLGGAALLVACTPTALASGRVLRRTGPEDPVCRPPVVDKIPAGHY
jgi:hypothetical protein